VTGTIIGDGVTLDLSKVVVEAKRPWNWLPPKVATVANGGINASTGVYTISGLGTDDYVIKAGAYGGWRDPQGQPHQGIDDYTGDGRLAANLGVGVTIERVFVQNNANTPTTKNITLEQGYSISGTISLSSGTEAPWHDINDNGKKDTNVDPTQSEVVSMAVDVQGQPVMAMPMEMMFMGGQDPRMGAIQADGTYQIPGLSAGVYIVMPPASSPRIEQLIGGDMQGAYYDGGQQTHHWTTVPQMVVVTGEDVTGVNFTFGNGYNITGRLTLPEAQTSQQEWEQWQWVGQLELETPQHSFMGHGKPLFKRDFNNSAT
jgi:hypothetical protein